METYKEFITRVRFPGLSEKPLCGNCCGTGVVGGFFPGSYYECSLCDGSGYENKK